MSRPLPWILASGSPARRELAKLLGAPFEVCRSDAPEPRRGPVRERVLAAARRKARAVARRFPGRVILACDTLVVLDGEVFGKPRSWKQATGMLERLSGRTHQILTALWTVAPDGSESSVVETTRVTFLKLPREVWPRLARRMHSLDKSGGYAIQRHSTAGNGPVKSIRGSYTNVIGLPVLTAARLLETIGVDVRLPPGARTLDRKLNPRE